MVKKKTNYRPYTHKTYEVSTFDNDRYISTFNSLKSAIKYCESNAPVKYTIKKIMGTVM